MELSERFIETLEKQGYSNIEELQLKPEEELPSQSLPYKTVFMVTDGALKFISEAETKTVNATEKHTVSPQRTFKLKAGPTGAIYIYAEMLE